MVRGPEPNHDAEERLRGYRAALDGAGIDRDPALEAPGDFTEDGGYQAVRRLLALSDPPTALFAANDSTAIGAMSALRDAGIAIPGGMAVAGFDDIPIARYVTPALSSVRVSISDLGTRAMEQLVRAVEQENRHDRTHQVLGTALVIRDSCGAHPPAAAPAGRGPPPGTKTG
jgi:LacI family transcriptional regulator